MHDYVANKKNAIAQRLGKKGEVILKGLQTYYRLSECRERPVYY